MTDPEFDDGKEEGALRTIGEVSKALDIKSHVLRYWEQQFPMLDPLKRSGGRRYYRPEDVALIQRIDELVNKQGYTLKGAKQAIEENPVSSDGIDGKDEVQDIKAAGDHAGIGEATPLEASEAGEAATAPADTSESADNAMSRSEIIERLKEIRTSLAAAL
ncbi:MAG: MerR family transcriptional regulator [Sphingomonadaceae bacterium]|nr:MerR family transcriptional regulator [Sphingomonadaceae bacterium]